MPTESAHDVAAYILKKIQPMTAMKLQKLLYYSQAWSLVWDEKKLFKEPIEAWANGPVVPKIYQVHRGEFQLSAWSQGKASNLSKEQRETVDAVLDYYGKKSAQWLSDLSHREKPWRNARAGLDANERGNCTIKLGDMAEYYSSLRKK